MKTLFLKILPYAFSLLGGVVVYIVTIYIEDNDLSDLMVNVAAGLLSIPLIFICYELVRNVSTSKINKELSEHLNLEINHNLRGIIKAMQTLVPPKSENFDVYLALPIQEVKKRLDTEGADMQLLLEKKSSIDKLIVGNKHVELLSRDRFHAVFSVSKELRILTTLLGKKAKNNDLIAASMFDLMQSVTTLMDSIEEDSIVSGKK